MPRDDYKNCRECGQRSSECGPLSHTRLCAECAEFLLAASILEQKAHRGPIFQRWRVRIAASVGAHIEDTREAV